MAVEKYCLISIFYYQVYICDIGKRWQRDNSGELGYFSNLQIKIHRSTDFVLIPPSIYRNPVELTVSVHSVFSSGTRIFVDISYWHGQHSPGWDCELASCGPPKRNQVALAFSQLKRNKFELVTYRWKGLWLHICVWIMQPLPNAIFGLLIQVEKTPYNSGLLLGFTTFF